MRAFCTLFDKYYLLQGVALYSSLRRHSKSFKLYVLCMDQTAFQVLSGMKLEGLVLIGVEDLLTPEVLAVRERTTHGQFCWVCQPLICRFVLDKFQEEMVTYLEADSLFFSDPEQLFDEMAGYSVSLVPHNFGPGREDLVKVSGKFCVQFNVFRNGDAARTVLDHWRSACFKYTRQDLEYLPGQTCLDDWPEKFSFVRVIQHPGAGVAPWNIERYKFSVAGARPHVDGVPVVFYHFHAYGRYKNGDHALCNNRLTRAVVVSVYGEYVRAMRDAEAMVLAAAPSFHYRKEYENLMTLKDLLWSFTWGKARQYYRVLKKRILMPYNNVPDSFFTDSSVGDKS